MTKSKRGRLLGPVDLHVGMRIRERRIMLGPTQQQFADMIGVTPQQVHKYERGTNRISAGRLYEIAQCLNVPVSYFYDGLSDAETPRTPPSHERRLRQIAQNFNEIVNESHREALSNVVRAIAGH